MWINLKLSPHAIKFTIYGYLSAARSAVWVNVLQLVL
jgi:hypothetical protein